MCCAMTTTDCGATCVDIHNEVLTHAQIVGGPTTYPTAVRRKYVVDY